MEFKNFSMSKKTAFAGNGMGFENIRTYKYKNPVFLRRFQ